MKDIAAVKKTDKFDEKDFNAYMRELAKQAKKMGEKGKLTLAKTDTPDYDASDSDGNEDADEDARQKNRKSRKRKRKPYTDSGNKDEDKDEGDTKRNRTAPKCLNPKCPDHHYLKDCKINPKELTKELLAKWRKKGKKGRSGNEDKTDSGKEDKNINALKADGQASNSALFSGSFASGAIETMILTDQGSDTNLISTELFHEIRKAGGITHVAHLVPPQIFIGVGANAQVTCALKVQADVDLSIRHGSALLLRNVKWKVCNEPMKIPLIGRPLLDSIGCNNEHVLIAISDRNAGVIDTTEMSQEPETAAPDPKVAALLEEAIFHSAGGCEKDGLESEDIHIDIGDDPDEDLVRELETRVTEAREKGLSENGCKRLRELLFRHKRVFE